MTNRCHRPTAARAAIAVALETAIAKRRGAPLGSSDADRVFVEHYQATEQFREASIERLGAVLDELPSKHGMTAAQVAALLSGYAAPEEEAA